MSDDADALCYNNDLGRITDLLKIAQEGLIFDELSLVDGYVFFYCHEIVGARVFNRLLTIKVSDKVSKGFENTYSLLLVGADPLGLARFHQISVACLKSRLSLCLKFSNLLFK